MGIRAALGVPLIREGQVFAYQPDSLCASLLPEKQIELVETFADQAVIAIENVRLFEEVQAKLATSRRRWSIRPEAATS